MNNKDIIKTTQIIFWAILTGQIVFLVIAVFLVQSSKIEANPELTFILMIVILMLVIPAIVVGPMVYRTLLTKSLHKKSVEDKLIAFRQNTIIKLALIEAPVLFSLVSFIITGNYIFAVIALAVLVLFVFHKPTTEKFAEDYKLSVSEVEKHQR